MILGIFRDSGLLRNLEVIWWILVEVILVLRDPRGYLVDAYVSKDSQRENEEDEQDNYVKMHDHIL